ncbi:MAG: response regulator [Anaerolineae bacterium]|nr:response regulator [Anaerolineae bacterium]
MTSDLPFDPRKYTLLVVDDTPANLGVAADYLEMCGFEIITATSGENGLDKAARLHPDLILLDVMMPGVNGFEACRRLKADKTTQDIPVIFMTALVSEDDKVQGFEAGGVDYVTKPILHRELLARVTTHLRIQDQARQLIELNAGKDKFFSILAHDLRGPFGPLLQLSEILAGEAVKGETQNVQSLSARLHEGAEVVYQLLENLLQWARIQQGRMPYAPETLSLAEMAEQVFRLLYDVATQKNIMLQSQVGAEVKVQGDAAMLNAVLRNLVSNAIKFTPQGGRVTTQACLSKRSVAGKWVEVLVCDTGVGMSPEDQSKLFRLDVHHSTEGTAQEQGTGLGLLVCREMVEKHGGELWVESTVGQGTKMHFTLPLDAATPEDAFATPVVEEEVAPVVVEPAHPLDDSTHLLRQVMTEMREKRRDPTAHLPEREEIFVGKRILLADDEVLEAFALSRLLTEKGLSVTIVRSGAKVLEALEGVEFDLILLSVRIKDMDGYETIRRIRMQERWQTLPVLALIAKATLADDREKCRQLGMSDCLPKPVDADEMFSVLRKRLQKS